jgi:hypothetical protein
MRSETTRHSPLAIRHSQHVLSNNADHFGWGGKSNPFYIRPTNQNVLHVKKLLLSFFFLAAVTSASWAQGIFINVTITGNDPSCQATGITATYVSLPDSAEQGSVQLQMMGALTAFGGMIPTTAQSAAVTICPTFGPNCPAVECMQQIVNANTTNVILFDVNGGGSGSNDADMDGYAGEADCNDNDPYSNPGMPEFCGDFADNNCDGAIDEGCGGGETDNDNDGFVGVFDCNDNDASINPNAIEICGDSIDNNCNILVDEGCNEGPIDFDMDGYYSNSDCNDMDYTINPGMPEICADNIDNNCNGVVDEEGCVGNPFDCNPEIALLTDSTSFGDEPGVVWILNNIPIVGVYSYMWDFGDGNTSTEPFPTNVYELAGTYTICLTTSGNGCTGTTCITFTVTPEGGFLPGGMPMTGFTLNVVSAIPNNVNEVAADAVLEAFPCPFNDELTVALQSPVAGLAQLSCYDMTGALVAQEQINVTTQRNLYSFATTTWSHGAYTIVLSTPAGAVRRVVLK